MKIDSEIRFSYFDNLRFGLFRFIPEGCRTFLEVGGGTGKFVALLKEQFNADVWNVEMNPEAATESKKRIENVLMGEFIEIFDNIPKNYFDCVIFNDVLEHMTDPRKALDLTKQLLSPNGIVFCSIPNVRYIRNFKEFIWDADWKYTEHGILDYTHLRFFTKKSIIRLFNDLGYEIIKLEGITPTRFIKLIKLLNIIFFGKISDIPYLQFVVLARKSNNSNISLLKT